MIRRAMTRRTGTSTATAVVVLLLVVCQFWAMPNPAAASHTTMKFPFAAGTAWSVLQGYNTNPAEGGSHYNCDPDTLKDTVSQSISCTAAWQYRYSLDLVEASGRTAGLEVLAPANGTVRWTETSTGGISINLGDGYAVALFHVLLNPGIGPGTVLTQGQAIGTVAPPNVANNGGTPHIHLTLWETTDGGNWSRKATPFSGSATIDGVNLPDKGSKSFNQYRGLAVYSTNTSSGSIGQGPTPPGMWSPERGATVNASNGVEFSWSTSTGAIGYQVVIDDEIYSPWLSTRTWKSGPLTDGTHTWKVRAKKGNVAGVWSGARSFTVVGSGVTTGKAKLTLSDTKGAAAAVVTVTGSGFGGGERVDLRWDSTSGPVLKTVVANGSGAFSTQITIPDAKRGKHTIHAIGQTGKSAASLDYEVTPSLSRDPVSGTPGTKVKVTARGFDANEKVKITWHNASGSLLGTISTNAQGTGSVTITIPESPAGWNDYTGVGQTSKAQAYGAINVLSTFSLSPANGKPGDTIAAKAIGMTPGAAFKVTFNDIDGKAGATLCSGNVSNNGVASCGFKIPTVNAGAYPVTITVGSTSIAMKLSVTGPPAISVSPSSAAVGTDVTVTVGGFRAGETVTISWGTIGTWRSEKADANGDVRIRATVPENGGNTPVLRARGSSSGSNVTTDFSVTANAAPGATSVISPGVYSVYATREGLVGGTTSSGHVIVENDYFVALPGCTPSNCKGGFTPGNMTQCGAKCYVKVINPATNVCRVEPILDTGPWFTVDDWWNPTNSRYLNNLPTNPNTLAQGYTGADAARNGLDVGYGKGPNGIGRDNTGTISGRPWREVGNRAAIDLADGTWRALAPQSDRTGATITVEMLWQTGADPGASAAACGHPLNQKGGTPTKLTPGKANPSFSGRSLGFSNSFGSSQSSSTTALYDGSRTSNWTSARNTPETAWFTVDLGADRSISGVKWMFAYFGYADTFYVSTKSSAGAVTQLGAFTNGDSGKWWGVSGLNVTARFVTFMFTNPNHESVVGSVSEVQVWGRAADLSPGASNPAFSGTSLPVFSSSGTSGSTWTGALFDGNQSSNWTSPRTTPSSAGFTIDLGSDKLISGVKWMFAYSGYADSFTVTITNSNGSTGSLGKFGNGASRQWWGVSVPGRTARYITFNFTNPNRDSVLGSVGEVQVWGAIPNNGAGEINPSFSGGKYRLTNSIDTPSSGTAYAVRDGNLGSNWISPRNTPSSASIKVDIGSYAEVTGIRWMFAYSGYADQFTVSYTTLDGQNVTLGTYGNGSAGTWYGVKVPNLPKVRFVTFTFANPNRDSLLGSVAEIEVWGPRGSGVKATDVVMSAAVVPEATPVASPIASPVVEPVASPQASPESASDTGSLATSETASTPDFVATPESVADAPATPQPEASPAFATSPEPVPVPTETPENLATPAVTDASPESQPVQPEPEGPEVDTGTPVTELPAATPDSDQPPASGGDNTLAPTAENAASPAPGGDNTLAPTAESVASPAPGGNTSLTETPDPGIEPAPEPTQAVTAIGYVANTEGDGVNCRIGPGTDFDLVRWLAEGSELRLIGAPVDGWQQVICDGGSGYVAEQFVSLDAPAPEMTPTATATVAPELTPTIAATLPDADGTPVADGNTEVPTESFVAATIAPQTEGTPPSDAPDDEVLVTEPTSAVEPTFEPTPTVESIIEPTATLEPTLEPAPTLEPTLEPTPTIEPTVALVPVEREIVIPVSSDTSVSGISPDAVQLPDDRMTLPAGGSNDELAVLTFDVSGIGTAEVVSAQLVLTGAGDSGGAGGQLLVGQGVWFDESTTSWQSVANVAPWQYTWIDWISPGVATPVDVTSVVTGDGTISFVVVGTPEQEIAIASREQGNPAYIVVTVVEYLPSSQ